MCGLMQVIVAPLTAVTSSVVLLAGVMCTPVLEQPHSEFTDMMPPIVAVVRHACVTISVRE